MSKLQQFLYDKLTDCEALFEQANTNSDIIYIKGMLEIGGIQTQLIANIGKRQAYQEVLEFIRKHWSELNMSESTAKWKIEHSRVYGKGMSFNCTNRVTAEQLYNTLTNYERDITLEQNISKQYDTLTKQIIALQMDLSNVQDTVNKLKETIQCLSK